MDPHFRLSDSSLHMWTKFFWENVVGLSIRNEANTADNDDSLKLPRSDWFENLSDKLSPTGFLLLV